MVTEDIYGDGRLLFTQTPLCPKCLIWAISRPICTTLHPNRRYEGGPVTEPLLVHTFAFALLHQLHLYFYNPFCGCYDII